MHVTLPSPRRSRSTPTLAGECLLSDSSSVVGCCAANAVALPFAAPCSDAPLVPSLPVLLLCHGYSSCCCGGAVAGMGLQVAC